MKLVASFCLLAFAVLAESLNLPRIDTSVKFNHVKAVVVATAILTSSPTNAHAGIDAIDGAINSMTSKSYSTNAKNFERMANGDFTMGFQETSNSDRALKRRAAASCKKGVGINVLVDSEKSCMKRVMDNDMVFIKAVLDARKK